MSDEAKAVGPELILVPPKQGPANADYVRIAQEVRASLGGAIKFLSRLPPYPSERDKSVWTWNLSLTTLAYDVSDGAISAAAFGPSLRTARVLNRVLLEYSMRVHLYVANPEYAETHVMESENMIRRVMKPLAEGNTEPSLKDVRQFVASGSTKAKQPKSDAMLAALVGNFVADPEKGKPYFEFLEAEYALGSAFVHGSQAAFIDVLDGGKRKVHPRSRALERDAETLRCATTLITLLVGLEITYPGSDFHAAQHVSDLQALGPYDKRVSMGTHDTLRILLGIL